MVDLLKNEERVESIKKEEEKKVREKKREGLFSYFIES